MKRLLFGITLCAFCLSAFIGGVSFLSAAKANIEVTDGVNYKYLREPLMLAADVTNIYLVNEYEEGSYELVTINKNNDLPDFHYTLTFKPLHIDVAGGYIFLFESNRVRILTTALSSAPTSNINFESGYTNCTAFHVASFTGYIRIYYAQGSKYRWNDYNADLTQRPQYEPEKVLTSSKQLVIDSITNNTETVYLGVRTGTAPVVKRIYRHTETATEAIFEPPLGDIISLRFINNKLIYISDVLHLIDLDDESNFKDPEYKPWSAVLDTSNLLSTRQSRTPIFVNAFSKNEIYVIDRYKHSIDEYKISDTGTLEFARTVRAHFGSDGGFYVYPEAVCVIDENRYVIGDTTGVKLIDMSKPTGEQIISIVPSVGVKRIVYDAWQNIYLFNTNDEISKYEVTANNTITFKGIVTDPNETAEIENYEKLTKSTALGEEITLDELASYGIHPLNESAWSVDRLKGKIYWLSAEESVQHAIQSFLLPDYWTPEGKNHYDWEDTSDLLRYDTIMDSLFMTTGKTAVLYRYPNAIGPVSILEAGEQLRILRKYSVMYDNETAVNFNEYAYVLHPRTGQAYYTALSCLKANTGFATKELGFQKENNPYNQDEEPKYIGYSGRVLVHNLRIYKYPTSTNSNLEIKDVVINRNFGLIGNNRTPGLKLNREITVEDSRDRKFYEILVDENGVPPEDGYIDPARHIYVAYIDKGYVIDSFASPSSPPNFQSNARISLPSWMNNELPVCASADPATAYKNEYLQNNQRIRLAEPLDKNKTYTLVYYEGYDDNFELMGYVLTDYIVPDGITWWQITAIIALVFCVFIALFVGIRHIKANKKGVSTYP